MKHIIASTCALVMATCGLAIAQTKPADATPQDPLKRVMDSEGPARAKALARYIQAQVATNALFAGQYTNLRKLGDEGITLLVEWAIEAPLSVSRNEDNFRQACIRALRDVVDGEPPKNVTAVLAEIYGDEFEVSTVKLCTIYAMAQFGNRGPIDAIIADKEAVTEKGTARQQAAAWQQLADIHYNLRDYEAAVDAYLTMFPMIEAGPAKLAPRYLPIQHYNCACSMTLAGMTDAAFEQLGKALATGDKVGTPMSRVLLSTDQDISALRKDKRFAELMAKHYGAKDAGAEAKHDGYHE